VNPHEGEDQHRHLEHDAHSQDERRDEGEIFGRAQLVLDHLAAEIDQELERARKKAVVAEQHSGDEQQQHERPGRQGESPLARV